MINEVLTNVIQAEKKAEEIINNAKVMKIIFKKIDFGNL